ncbi:pyruvate dehydrogenase complex dihydrolipoamide acetyltransferase [Sphingomonas mali]|uniref:pyruvate dehydrogenase complex dihydrolipoamide acetyltransferase n=1 Tax=Sphingomonas mali TaxID=40682 RepID=UPI00082E83C4|nr:pyruvate dehydrogenase complex dihydrolipoamide acetyltransferase [Sphingomonas mali]
MPIELRMPALSPTMEEGTLARWLVKEGDEVAAGDVIAEIETDKATMEVEAESGGRVLRLFVSEGTDAVQVGTVIASFTAEIGAMLDACDEEAERDAKTPAPAPEPAPEPEPEPVEATAPPPSPEPPASAPPPLSHPAPSVPASPLSRRLATALDIDLTRISGSGANGRVIVADLPLERRPPMSTSLPPSTTPAVPAIAAPTVTLPNVPHDTERLSSMRKVIARRLTEAKQSIPHIYLTVDIRLDPLIALRAELNDALMSKGEKVSVNDMMIRALALALREVPSCNVSYEEDRLLRFVRSDIAVAVSVPGGLVTPIVVDAAAKSLSAIAREMKGLADRARDGLLQPQEYQGGTASLSNMGMYGIKQFASIINPPQAMIMAIGAAERRVIVIDDELVGATMMSATGSFDHRAIDGSDGAELMRAFKNIIETPLSML